MVAAWHRDDAGAAVVRSKAFLQLEVNGASGQGKVVRYCAWGKGRLAGIPIEQIQNSATQLPITHDFFPPDGQVNGGIVRDFRTSVARLPSSIGHVIDHSS